MNSIEKQAKTGYLKFIREFNQITIKGICDELNINHKNVYNGKVTTYALFNVTWMLKKKIEQLLLDEKYFNCEELKKRGEEND